MCWDVGFCQMLLIHNLAFFYHNLLKEDVTVSVSCRQLHVVINSRGKFFWYKKQYYCVLFEQKV